MTHHADAVLAEPSVDGSTLESAVIRRVSRRLLPFLFLLLVVNYLDRVNIGFAALRMNHDLGFSASAFGFGAGVFFVGYALFEVPSNLALHRVGARRWIARIMISWGIVSGAMALVNSEWLFYTLRFLLGVAEAGFLPGVVYYLTDWFPAAHRARAIAGVVVATALAPMIGSPISGAIMAGMDQMAGLHGWQWMFVLEAVPAVVLGVVTLFYLTDRPAVAAWLPRAERDWLEARLRTEKASLVPTAHVGVGALFRMGRIWALAAMFSCLLTAFYAVLLWLPQIVKQLGTRTDFEVGLITSIPYACAAVSMFFIARNSDRTGDRKRHIACALLVGGGALLISAWVASPVLSFALLCVAASGIWGTLPIVWSMASAFLTGAAAAGGIALVNTLAQVGGFAGPWAVGIIRDRTGSFAVALTTLAGFALLAAIIALLLTDDEKARRVAERAA
jgi:ACS family tartrate transporter-like MFS transporter